MYTLVLLSSGVNKIILMFQTVQHYICTTAAKNIFLHTSLASLEHRVNQTSSRFIFSAILTTTPVFGQYLNHQSIGYNFDKNTYFQYQEILELTNSLTLENSIN